MTTTMLDWLIVGGGVHGTHLSNVLRHQCGVPRDRLAVLDPFDEPMARWRHCTNNTGMKYLRSPVVHHVGLDAMDLFHFARSKPGRHLGGFRPPYDRPSLGLFEAYCSHVCDENGLRHLRRKGRAVDMRRHGSGGFRVDTTQGLLKARRVVLATGRGDSLSWPSWARALKDQGADVWHLFDQEFSVDLCSDAEEIIVVGLGISAGQFALRQARKSAVSVHVVSRHEMRVHQFDSEPCWLGPRCQVPFRRRNDYEERREVIDEARHRGSMSPQIARRFRSYVDGGRIGLTYSDVEAWQMREGGRMELELADGTKVSGDAVVLATGFDVWKPDQSWLSDAVERLDLKCAACGYPIVDEYLQWIPGLHVSGSLAELELGPAAGNIAGARMTSRRLATIADQQIPA